MMEQQHIDITDIQVLKRFLNRRLRIGKLIRIELRNYENLLSWHSGIPDCLANLLFIPISMGCIDQAHTAI